jgi:pilus assembly protein TadC
MIRIVLLGGALIGLGLFLCLRELFPAPPALGPALERYAMTTRPAVPGAPATRSAALGRWLAARIAGTPLDPRIPRADLNLLGKTVEGYLVQKLVLLVAGLAGPVLLWTVLLSPPGWLLSTGFTLVYAAFLFLAPDIALRSQAQEARDEFRTALITYLDLVRMLRAAGAGPTEALELPVKVCHGWAFARLAVALDPATLATRDTWDELTRLADQIDIRELADTAAIARRADIQGAAILDTLTAKATSLRNQQLANALSRAKSRTESMTVPVALSVVGYLILLGYPAYTRVVGG